jgi:cytosine/creatinine deaminase
MIDLVLRNGITQDGPARSDFAIDRGMIIARGPGLDFSAKLEIDLDGRLLVPGFVESHVHLDIALMNDPRRPGRAKPFQSPLELNQAMEQRRKAFTRDDIEQRAERAVKLANRHGVTAMRAQCHVDPEVGLRHLEALVSVREKLRDVIELQIVAFPQQGLLKHPATPELFREAFRSGADVMGCAPNLEQAILPANRRDPLQPDGIKERRERFRRHIDCALDLAMELDVDLDMHADLSLASDIELDDLEIVYLARRALMCGYTGRVTAGHVCALDSASPAVAGQAIELIARAKISVISQPDMYRLGRTDARNVRRGLTRVKQLLAAGVNVAFASNNVRDAYRPLGNFDLLEEGLILAYGAHMDSVDELDALLRMCTDNAAKAVHLEGYGLEPGCSANMVVLDAPSPSAAIVDQAEKSFVIKSGKIIATNEIESSSTI